MHHAMHIMTENGALHGVYVIHTIYISGGMREEATRDVIFSALRPTAMVGTLHEVWVRSCNEHNADMMHNV